MSMDGVWLPILEYASIKKTSISTIRRAIKAGHVKYKEESGRYLIWTKRDVGLENAKQEISLKLENEFLKKKNRELNEEIEDLKMLLQVYERKPMDILPPIPELDQ